MTTLSIEYGTVETLTVTHLNSLGSSATAGWISDAIDNTTDGYIDFLVQFQLAAVNTAPSGNKAFYAFVAGLVDAGGSAFATTGASSGAPGGSEGTLTYPDITSGIQNLPLLGIIPYVTQNIAINSDPFSVAEAFNGKMPPKFCIGLINYAGMTIASSGNAVKVTPVSYASA